MYIKNIKINDWRYLQFNNELIFKSGINLILGKNGSGKTSILQLIQSIFFKNEQPLTEEMRKKGDGEELVVVKIDNNGDEIYTNNHIENNIGKWLKRDLITTDNIRFITSSRSITNEKSITNSFKPIYDENSEIGLGANIDVAEEFNKMIHKELYKLIKEEIENGEKYLLEMQKDYQDGLVDFEKEIKITLDKDNIVTFIDHKGREISIQNLSSGEKEYIYFYSFLRRIKEDRGKIILIDEPELHLHSNQIRKLCGLINNLAANNQVIIATHSGEILQHFMPQANLILISKNNIKHIDNSEKLKEVFMETGLPIDPSVFTAYWICAENNPNKIISSSGLTTPEILSLLFGIDIERRYWSFGSNRELSIGYMEGIESVISSQNDIKITPILDGDKLAKSSDDFIPNIPEQKKEIVYFPFWELENIFLCSELLNKVIMSKEGKTGSDLFWEKIEDNKERLINQIKKTIGKNYFRKYSLDKYIKSNVEEELKRWKEQILKDDIDLSSINGKFNQLISDRNWKWIPGKEALEIAVSLDENFWKNIKILKREELLEIFKRDPVIKNFIDEMLTMTRIRG